MTPLHRTSHFSPLHFRLRTTSACCRTSYKTSSLTFRPRWKPGSKLRSTCHRYLKSLTQKVIFSCSFPCFWKLSCYLVDPASSSAGLAYKSRIRQEPTNVTAPQWANALWNRLSSLIEDMAGACVKVCFFFIYFLGARVDCCDLQVYTLEKVLKLKKDPVSQIVFLDEAMKVGLEVLATLMSLLTWFCRCWKIGPAQFSGLPWHERWKSRPGTGQKVRDLSSESGVLFDHLFEDSTFLQQTLSSGYPKFLRLFHEFFSKIAVHTDTVYTQVRQRSACAFQCTLRLTYTPFQPRNRPCSSCPFNLRSVVPITRIQQDE